MRFFPLIILFILSISVNGQTKDSLHVAKGSNQLKYTSYKVKAGDNWTAIAREHQVTVQSLRDANQKIKDLKPGDVLRIPPKNKEAQVIVNKDTTKVIKTELLTNKDTSHFVRTESHSPKDSTAKSIKKETKEQGIASWIEDANINPNKYFALHRTAPVGTVIKVTNRMNGKSVFVKVVGSLPDTGDNESLIIKISKASAQKLNVRDKRFQCELSYAE